MTEQAQAPAATSIASAHDSDRLFIVVPVFNEEASVGDVIVEWTAVFDSIGIDYQLTLINDGSTDSTSSLLDDWARRHDRIRVVHKRNGGHGSSCLLGYDMAVRESNGWVFQIDSDGQCDPRFFAEIWNKRRSSLAVIGTRVQREDGWPRRVISKVAGWTVFFATGVAVADPNVPYRLIRADVLRAAISEFPTDFYLANIFLSLVLKKGLGSRLTRVEIGFRRRCGGSPSVKWFSFFVQAVRLVRALDGNRARLEQCSRAVLRVASTAECLTI